jgi:hypothetical protein
MGYSTAAILVKEQINQKDFAAFLEDCGFADLGLDKKVTFREAERSWTGAHIGNYNGSTILLSNALFYLNKNKNNLFPIEEVLISNYRERKVLFIQNVESAMAYYYHVMDKGRTLRMKLGSEDRVEIDLGQELEAERNYYQEKYMNADGQLIYKVLNTYKNRIDEYTHYEIGGDIAFQLCTEFVGCHYANMPGEIEMDQFQEI